MPARLSELTAVCRPLGISIDKPKKGSHWKATMPGFRPYPIPAHNGERTEISDTYIRGLCRNFDLDFAVVTTLLGR